MIIAVASEVEDVAEHFGHCSNFSIYKIEDEKIVNEESIENPGHKPGFLPRFLHDQGVNVIISGGMGKKAIDIFNENEIEVVVGAGGKSKEAAEMYIKGDLESTGSVCTDHEHQDECGNH